jgi:Icc-related predicted phosphoesterase
MFHKLKILKFKCPNRSYITHNARTKPSYDNQPIKKYIKLSPSKSMKTESISNQNKSLDKKTRIYGISDLHLEYYNDPMTLYSNISDAMPHADILILAGDIGYPDGKHAGKHADNYMFLLDRFKQKYKEVLLVPGNHEYFQTINYNRDDIKTKLKDICNKTSCHLLDNQTIRLHGVDFIGTTLWTKIDPLLKQQMDRKARTFGTIFKDFGSYQDEFDRCFKFLQNELATNNNKKKVIITHHVPSYKLQHPKYKDKYKYNSMFYSDILDLLDLTDVKYWFCGHTHEPGFLMHPGTGTQVLINPYGTPWEQVRTRTVISDKVLLI